MTYHNLYIAQNGNCSTAIVSLLCKCVSVNLLFQSDNEGVEIFVHALVKVSHYCNVQIISCYKQVLRILSPQIAIVVIFAPLKPYDEERETLQRVMDGRLHYPVSNLYFTSVFSSLY